MVSTVTMVCLANSRKHGGRCVAGFTWSDADRGRWIRPVTPYGNGELNWEHFYRQKGEPQPLDVMQIGLDRARPAGFHTEDHLIDVNTTWQKVGVVTFSQIAAYAESSPAPLWVDAGSTSHGLNDRIPADRASELSHSLKLIRVRRLTLSVALEGGQPARKRVRGSLQYGNSYYTLPVTDPVIEKEFAELDAGAIRVVRAPLLCLSVSELFAKRNEHYKLIAAVIEQN